jgi:hypothetical protein
MSRKSNRVLRRGALVIETLGLSFALCEMPGVSSVVGLKPGSFSAPVMALAAETHAQAASPYEVAGNFVPTGWMGDGEAGEKYVRVDEKSQDTPHSMPSCTMCVYTPDAKGVGWAAVAYQYPANNWGEKPGKDLSGAGYIRVTFWARGSKGGERIGFKTLGHTRPQAKFPSASEVDLGFITLTNSWKQYSIDIKGKDLSNVVCALAWVVRQADHAGKVVFYLDDIQFE